MKKTNNILKRTHVILFLCVSIFLNISFTSCEKSGNNPIDEPDKSDTLKYDPSFIYPKSFWVLYNTWKHTDEQIREWIRQEANRRQYVLLNASDHRFIQDLKTINPNIKILLYKNMTSADNGAYWTDWDGTKYDYNHPTSGVGYQYADKYHPEWFLLDNQGDRVNFKDYPSLYQFDVGIVEYQNKWIDNVITVAKNLKFDGIYVDDVLFNLNQHHPDIKLTKYNSDAEYQKSFISMIKNIREQVDDRAPEMIIFGNFFDNAVHNQDTWKEYFKYFDGTHDEWWTVGWDNEYENFDTWKFSIEQGYYFRDNKKTILLQPSTPLSPKNKFHYAYASYLLIKSDYLYFAEMETWDNYSPPSPWRVEFSWNLGNPQNDYYTVGTNPVCYRRDFDKGIVIVNPNTTGTYVMDLNGVFYDENGLKIINNFVSVPPRTGRILRTQ